MALTVLMNGFFKLCPGLHYLTANHVLKTLVSSSLLHTTAPCTKKLKLPKESTNWITNNDRIYPPQEPGEPRRPAIRGMSIDEAIKQLSFHSWKGSAIVKEILLEAQEEAVNKHNVEYKSNLWIDESFVGKGKYIRGLRKHARARFGKVEYKYCHYFVRLVEGTPPEHYYKPEATGNEKLKDYLDQWRRRNITLSL